MTQNLVPADLTSRCMRFVYNYALRLCADTWYGRQTRIGYAETYSALMVLRALRQYRFLTAVPQAPLEQSLRLLDSDFTDFRAGMKPYPRFKDQDDEASLYAAPALPGVAVAKLTVRVEYPISTRCFDCGYFLTDPPASLEWTCPECGVIRNTAENTAKNADAVRRALEANGEG